MAQPACEYKPGLEGVPVAKSSISYVDGKEGILKYRGINIEELATKSTFFGNCIFINLGPIT